jgi:predicted nucleic acid-binding protein
LVIKEFCKKLQIITFNKLFDKQENYKLIFLALKDQRLHVRTTAADCINECIRMISFRDYHDDQKNKYLDLIYKEVELALFNPQETDINY